MNKNSILELVLIFLTFFACLTYTTIKINCQRVQDIVEFAYIFLSTMPLKSPIILSITARCVYHSLIPAIVYSLKHNFSNIYAIIYLYPPHIDYVVDGVEFTTIPNGKYLAYNVIKCSIKKDCVSLKTYRLSDGMEVVSIEIDKKCAIEGFVQCSPSFYYPNIKKICLTKSLIDIPTPPYLKFLLNLSDDNFLKQYCREVVIK